MKKIFFPISFCLIFCLICACGGEQDKISYAPSVLKKSEDIVPRNNVSITTEKEKYSTKDAEIKYTLSISSNASGVELYLSSNAIDFLQIEKEDGWYNVPFRQYEDGTILVFPEGLVVFEAGDIRQDWVDLDRLFELPLEAGKYRIVRDDNIVSNSFLVE